MGRMGVVRSCGSREESGFDKVSDKVFDKCVKGSLAALRVKDPRIDEARALIEFRTKELDGKA